MAVELAVGRELEPGLLLQPHDFSDRVLLDAQQCCRFKLAFLGRFARRNERIGPDQAADMIGTERRFAARLHE